MDAAHKWTDEQIAALEKRMSASYELAAKEMGEKQRAAMQEYQKELEEREAKLDGSPESNEQHSKWLREQAIRNTWLSSMVDELSIAANNTNVKAMDMVNDSLPRVYSENANWSAYQIDKDTGYDLSFAMVSEDTVRYLFDPSEKQLFPAKNPDGVKLETLTNKVDSQKDIRWNKQKFTSAITQGILQGESIDGIVARTASIFGSNKAAAYRAARTSITGAENAGRISSFQRAKNLGIDIMQEWLATLDGRTRIAHRELDGEKVPVGEPFDSEFGDIRFPGDPEAHPANVYNCRCTLIAAVEGLPDDAAERWSRLPDGITYEEWKSGEYQTNRRNVETKASLDSFVSLLATKSIAAATQHEEAVTKLLTTVASENNSYMKGLEHRLKTAKSLQRKIRSDAMDDYGKIDRQTLQAAASGINDVLRYTMIATQESFGEDVDRVFSALYDMGYKFSKVKNTLAVTLGTYRGLNTKAVTPDGYVFELQFHTEETFAAKDVAHQFYDIERTAPKGSKERQEAHDAGARIFTSLKTPVGSGSITIDTGNPNKPVWSTVISGIASLDKENEIDGGFTIDLQNGRAYKLGESSGYAVGGYGTEVIVKKEDYENEARLHQILSEYIESNANAFSSKGACLGGWVPSSGPHEGELFLDVSMVTQSRKDAAMKAISKGEDSITDFKNIDWISTEELAEEYGQKELYDKMREVKERERGD